MGAFAGSVIIDDAIWVNCVDLLPSNVSRLLNVFKAASFNEQAMFADELEIHTRLEAAEKQFRD